MISEEVIVNTTQVKKDITVSHITMKSCLRLYFFLIQTVNLAIPLQIPLQKLLHF